ncbi:polysaccharide deacetylase family protein [Legionella taurinensis]|uniref:Polysaccharide deacetylase family protein n=1 Tax=Legionella taurinensis TaxID=70611 RepID=A0AB38N6N9_9GAMM|nr:polysaccharide deacetylase family protein [Legionella taurinensis]MDX1836054.1 polysaccharide deacetylase family protein [Legionella taurinensis]PUT42169.1 hypothetical protein DB744_03525 [Legionella taurinensis]PUT44956.1 hypothetical protein DB746_03525 [Legionella taurinensis]PUT48278.1 hypothetical protein DB743_01690 [Legionella taurinensis]PUT49091.1 hypothetical protein DB745_03525 [Legionella taurinensis]
MLVVLMYHRVSDPSLPGRVQSFQQHLKQLVGQYPVVIPGDPLDRQRVNLCLTFDDAYYDFYRDVFPLLKQYQIKAVLAIPVGLILEDTTLDDATRLGVPYAEAMASYQSHATLCTWKEINEMVSSGLVIPAVHGMTHQHLTAEDICLETEVVAAKHRLQQQTGYTPDTFIYPYGSMNSRVNRLVRRHYPYRMRIGSASNWNWHNAHGLIYRINAEEFWPDNKPLLSTSHRVYLGARCLFNTLRFK